MGGMRIMGIMGKLGILGVMGVVLLLAACSKDVKVNDLKIIPEPVSIQKSGEAFILEDNVSISISGLEEGSNTVKTFLNTLRRAHLKANVVSSNEKSMMKLVVRDSLDPLLGSEGYRIEIGDGGIVFSANTEQGLFYACQTFVQMLPPDILERSYSSIALPYCTINDYPRYPWRAVYLDVCSHYQSPTFVKKVLDIMASYKMNRLVWHLADNHGWRLPSRRYPMLNVKGSWRVYRPNTDWNDTIIPGPKERANYGGFYTRQDIANIIKYADSLNIEVIPSIEIPGHCSPILSAYPQLSCDNGDYPIPCGAYTYTTPILCAGNDSTLIFVNDVLDEIAEMFPSKYIHLGGKEADMNNWSSCSKCRNRMHENHLSRNEQLFAWFLQQAAQHLDSLGRTPLTWDLPDNTAPLVPNAIVISKNFSSGAGAAQAGNRVVMCPDENCNFSRYQNNPNFHSDKAADGITTLRHVYTFSPTPSSSSKNTADNIIGAQCLLTTEYISNESDAEYMLLPRLLALSEVLWSPSEARSWNRFRNHVEEQKMRLRTKGYNICEGSFMPTVESIPIDTNILSVTISIEVPNTYLFYTTDGSTPTRNSQVYISPIKVAPNTTLKVLPVYQDKPQDSIYVFSID